MPTLVHNHFLVDPGSHIRLRDIDPADTGKLRKKTARQELEDVKTDLNELQSMLYANKRAALLVVLQGMDTSGKDGTIKHVMSAFNPQGCQVTSFKVPTEEERDHDFLWRVHRAVPRMGMVGIFNRSHYEDVLVARVDELVPHKVWEARYEAINAFEKFLADNGTIILKFCLHISKDEQRGRLQDRLEDPTDHWKFRTGDLTAREKWDDYMGAYEDAVNRCSTPWAPWYVIPADKKWYRNLIISRIVVARLRQLNMEWPALDPGMKGIEIK